MSSGVPVDNKVLSTFKEIMGRKFRAAIFKINGDLTLIEVEDTAPIAAGAPKGNWEAMCKKLPETDCRYLAYDFEYEHQGAKKNRIIFVLWSPDSAPTKSKLVYAASREGIVSQLQGVQRAIEANDDDEIDYNAISKKLAQHTAGY